MSALVSLLALALPAASSAAISAFGSPLGVPATLNTAEDLNYTGSGIAVPGAVIRIPHDGADTALWNVALPDGAPVAPAAGQVLKFSLEGCAKRPQGAPAPLTQIHFQDLVPQPDGGARINVTSQAFDIPVCGEGGASGSTVTSYEPTHFCVAQGDYVAFNDEGGWVPGENGGLSPYPSGVPYMVIGSVKGATMDSFIRGGGTNNGALISPSDSTYHDGFAANHDQELMLQATLGTGADANKDCGGTQGLPPGGAVSHPHAPLPPLRVGKQTDGINHRRIAGVAMYCRLASGCSGVLTLQVLGGARQSRQVKAPFKIVGGKTVHLPVRVPSEVVKLARTHGRGVPMKLTALVDGKTITQTIVLRIF
jgi:hypothetical protein